MMNYNFIPGNSYTKKEIYRICGISLEKQGENWKTNCLHWEGNWFIFCTIEAYEMEHYYNDRLVNSYLHGYSKQELPIYQNLLWILLNPFVKMYVFYRTGDRSSFTYVGATSVSAPPILRDPPLPEEVSKPHLYTEGAIKKISVNAYERSAEAINKCKKHYGVDCYVCGLNFEKVYGEIGRGYIHVHHLIPLADIGKEYVVDPIKDLRPVCPNCHAMLHQSKPPLNIDDLRARLVANKR